MGFDDVTITGTDGLSTRAQPGKYPLRITSVLSNMQQIHAPLTPDTAFHKGAHMVQ